MRCEPECDEYIRIFEYSNIFDPNIHSDIRSYHFLETNIFGYLFVSTFWIQIYLDIRLCHFLDTNMFGYSFVSKSIKIKQEHRRNLKSDMNENQNIFVSKSCYERISEYIRIQKVDTNEYPNIFVSKK